MQNIQLKLSELAFDKIFLTPRSYFRLGFIDSDSTLQLDARALNGFHPDQMAAASLGNARTKVSLELSNEATKAFRFAFPSEQEVGLKAGELANFPQLIEIETYEPSMSRVHVSNDSSSMGVARDG